MTRRARLIAGAVAVVCLAIVGPAFAQQTTITPAATQPGQGVLVQRTLAQATWWDVDADDFDFTDVTEFRTDLSFALGISGDWSLLATVPVIHRDFDGPAGLSASDPTGVGDPTIEIRHRFVNEPLGPVDTRRIAWLAGLEVPLGRDVFSSDSVDPYVGLAFTQITGRLGLGGALTYKATTGAAERPLHPGDSTADLLRLTGSSAWRLSPREWGSELEAAIYLTLEAEVTYETSGEGMFRLAPGVLVEAPNYALEFAVLLPVAEDVEQRPEHDIAIIAGFRVFF